MPAPDLAADDRGQALQLDFLISMVIRLIAFSVFLSAAVALTYSMVGTGFADKKVAERGADRLAEDLLVGSPSSTLLDASCTDAFFEADAGHGSYGTATCEFNADWDNDPEHYLHSALYVNESKEMNVTVRTDNGAVVELQGNYGGTNPTRLALGDSPPEQRSTVFAWHRQVGLDTDDDGVHEWVTINVRVW